MASPAEAVLVPTLRLYRFRCLDPLRGRWIIPRHVCAAEFRCRYSEYELDGGMLDM
jgi:hypothetical protein